MSLQTLLNIGRDLIEYVSEIFVPFQNTYKTRSLMNSEIPSRESNFGENSNSSIGSFILNKFRNDMKFLNTTTSFTSSCNKTSFVTFIIITIIIINSFHYYHYWHYYCYYFKSNLILRLQMIIIVKFSHSSESHLGDPNGNKSLTDLYWVIL